MSEQSYYIGDGTRRSSTEEEWHYIGTDLKFAIDITATGFDMANDDYDLVLSCGGKKVDVAKEDIVVGLDGSYILKVDSTEFPSGTLRLVGYPKVPDSDYVTGVRREVGALDLCTLKHPW